jgi:predicted transcriptional regulator
MKDSHAMVKRKGSAHTFVVHKELMRALDQLATRYDRSRSYIVRLAVKRLVEAERAGAPEPDRAR